MRIATRALVALLLASMAAPAIAGPPTIFRFESEEFWLNLHTFLYVLGRAEDKFPDASREAVARAPAEAQHGLQSLANAERQTWAGAVTAYARGASRTDPVFDRGAALLESRLADAADAPTLDRTDVDPAVRDVLERVAPIYRKAWWPEHRRANRAWVAATEPLLNANGRMVLDFITRAFQSRWPTNGYTVHVAAYSDWAGAFSTYGNFLLVASNASAGTSGWTGFETVFHESMHQFDDAIEAPLEADARAARKTLHRNLSHALIFFTAGEAVRRVAPAGYVTVADASGIWSRGMSGLKEALTEIWLPYLNGRGTRDEALAALAVRTGVEPPTFMYRPDDFWLNLHHFLYALGLAEAKSPDASRPALAPAVTEMERGIAQLTPDEHRAWANAVKMYASEWSGGTADRKFATAVVALANAGNAPTLAVSDVDPSCRATLERVAPIYRRVWWRAHLVANRGWQAQNAALVAQHGTAIRSYLAHAYPIDWPLEGRLVHVTAYANFGGAYSLINGGLLVVSSVDPGMQATSGLEMVFHEALHQWDPQTFAALADQARQLNVTVPRDLPHAMIFFTAGEAVKRVAPDYVPYMERFGIWDLKLSGASLPASRFKQPLLQAWKPFLDGRGSREDALAALLAQAAAGSK
jgi:hypothetical protein